MLDYIKVFLLYTYIWKSENKFAMWPKLRQHIHKTKQRRSKKY